MSKLRDPASNPRIVVAAAAAHAAQLRAPISNPLLSPGLAPGIASPQQTHSGAYLGWEAQAIYCC